MDEVVAFGNWNQGPWNWDSATLIRARLKAAWGWCCGPPGCQPCMGCVGCKAGPSWLFHRRWTCGSRLSSSKMNSFLGLCPYMLFLQTIWYPILGVNGLSVTSLHFFSRWFATDGSIESLVAQPCGAPPIWATPWLGQWPHWGVALCWDSRYDQTLPAMIRVTMVELYQLPH